MPRQDAAVQATIKELQAHLSSDMTAYYDSEYAQSCLFPAYQKGLTLLERGGADAVQQPVVLYAVFTDMRNTNRQDDDMPLVYFVSWLGMENDINGIFLRPESGNDKDMYPRIVSDVIGVGTVWRCAGGPVVFRDGDMPSVRPDARDQAIVVDETLHRDPSVCLGLIREDGTKTEPVTVFHRVPPKDSNNAMGPG